MDIRYGKAFYLPRKLFKHFLCSIYPLVILIYKMPKVASIEETLDKIIKDKVSICRFGDGELLYLSEKRSLPFQRQDERLRNRFIEILKSDESNILVGLPVGFQDLSNLKYDVKKTWQAIVVWTYLGIKPYLSMQKKYYNASITRLYIGFEDTCDSGRLFKKIRTIWDGKNILLIEGEKSRLGVGNDLFDNSISVVRILAPAHHAYDKYEKLLLAASEFSIDYLVLVALGPTAKPLVFDLAKKGYQAIDIGNLDTEYEWYRMGAKSIVKIKGKYTSEAKNGRIVEDITDSKYESQIFYNFSQ